MSTPQEIRPSRKLQHVYVLTNEEARVIRECKRESFWLRGVPGAIIGCTITNYLLYKGILTSRFTALPKVVFGTLMGFVIGKTSYINVCNKKLMRLENSPLAEELRQGNFPTFVFPDKESQNDAGYSTTSSFNSEPPVPEPPSGVYSSHYESSAIDVPFSASMSESSPTGISDYNAQGPDLVEEKAKPPPITYAELRKKHKDSTALEPPVREREKRIAIKPEVKKNKYGDVWEE